MKKAADVLRTVLDETLADSAGRYSSFFRSWVKIAGDDIAAHSSVADITNGIIFVKVDHPGWMQMIQLQQKRILASVRRLYPELEIRDMRYYLATDTRIARRSGDEPVGEPKRARQPRSAAVESEDAQKGRDSEEYREFRKLLDRLRNTGE